MISELQVKFNDPVRYKGYLGMIIAREFPSKSGTPSYLIAFPKPIRVRGENEQQFKARLLHYAVTFKCNPETLGPCVNVVVPETELLTESESEL